MAFQNFRTVKAALQTFVDSVLRTRGSDPKIDGPLHETVDAREITDIFASFVVNQADAYAFVPSGQTALENAANLDAQLANLVQAPGSGPLALITLPGMYDFGTTGLVLNSARIRIVGLGAPGSVIFTSQIGTGNLSPKATVMETVDNIVLYNITCDNTAAGRSANDTTDGAAFLQTGSFPNSKHYNVIVLSTGDTAWPTLPGLELSGEWTDCQGGNGFGAYSTWNGTMRRGVFQNEAFLNATLTGPFYGTHGNDDCFGKDGTVNSLFEDCHTNNRGFGHGASVAGATFIRCSANAFAFGWAGSVLSSTFRYCDVNAYGFFGGGGTVDVNSVFDYCRGDLISFGANDSGNGSTVQGTYRFCTGGFGSSLNATPGTISAAILEDCSGSFVSSSGATGGTITNSELRRCKGDFGCGTSGGTANVSVFQGCAGNFFNGSTTTGGAIDTNTRLEHCNGSYLLGATIGGTMAGEMFYCTSYEFPSNPVGNQAGLCRGAFGSAGSFASMGTVSGKVFGGHFPYIGKISGRVQGVTIERASTAQPPVALLNNAIFIGNGIVGGNAMSITSNGASINAVIDLCSYAGTVDGAITNTAASPHNVIA